MTLLMQTSMKDVATLISLLAIRDSPFTVRVGVGGHDLFSHWQLHNGVTIDLCKIAHIGVGPDSDFGLGFLLRYLFKELQK